MPSAAIVQMSLLPARVLVNAMRDPPGDHAGPSSRPALVVSWRWSVPSAAIDQTSLPGSSPSGPRSNAMRRPSGDHEGEESNTALSVIAADRAAVRAGDRDLDVVGWRSGAS